VKLLGDRAEHQTAELAFGNPGPDLKRVRAGDAVRLTGDPELPREADKRAREPVEGRLPLALTVSGRAGERLRVAASATFSDRTLSASAESAQPLEAARAGGMDASLLREKLGAFGGTPFALASIDDAALERGLHAPVSELKRLRRELVASLEAQLAVSPWQLREPRDHVGELRAELSQPNIAAEAPPQLVPLCRTLEQLEAVIASGFGAGDEVELDWMELVGLSKAVERARSAGLAVTLATVRVQKPGEESYDRRIDALAPDAVLVRHWGALMHFAGANKTKPIVHGDFSLNVTNSLTAHHLLGLGLRTITASHDLDRAQLLALLANVPRGRVALTLHHHIPTFHNSHCVYAHLLSSGKDYRSCGRPCEEHRVALRDFAGNDHPVVVDVSCRNTVFNAVAQSAAPLVPELLELGVRRFRVELVWERADEVTRTLAAYRKLLSGELTASSALKAASVHEQYGVTTLRR
jgi:putative protease